MSFLSCSRYIIIAGLISVGAGGAAAQEEAQARTGADDQYHNAVIADGLYYDAVKAHMLGDDKQSETLLLQVIKLKPDQPAPYYDLSRIAFKRNQGEQAAAYIKKAIALDGENKWYRDQYANILALRNDFTGAAEEFARLAKNEQHNGDYLLKAALLYQRAGKYKEALSELDQLEKKHVLDDEDILMQQQQIYLKMNDVEGAAVVIRKMIANDPSEPKYYGLLGELYENNKRPEKAKEVYAQMQQRFPNDPSLQLSLASQALKGGDTAKYKDYVRKAITNKQLNAETQLGLLLPYLQEINADAEQRREALMLAEQVVIQHPEDVKVLAFYGDVLSMNNQRDKAAAQYKKAIRIDPSRYTAWQQLLYTFTDRRDADSLIYYSEKAIRLFPNQARLHYLNGIGHYNKKEFTSAIRSINRAIDLQPDDSGEDLADMYSSLGDIYNTIKEYGLSDSSFDHSLALNPANATVLNNYAYYLSERNKRLDDAERMSKKSLTIRPGEGTFLDTYGWILYQQGKYSEALKYVQQAIDAAPDAADAALWEHLAAIHYKMGHTDKAVEAWQKAKARGSDNPKIDKQIADRKLYE